MKKFRERGSFYQSLFAVSKKEQAQAICIFLVLLLIVLGFAFFGTWIRTVDEELAEPNYNDFGNWAALPQKKDGADYVAAGCGENRQNEGALADTFYVYPTSFFHQTLTHAHTQDPTTNYIVDSGNLPLSASAFNGGSKVYVPRYRSVSQRFQDVHQKENETTKELKEAMRLAATDIQRAFEYYLQNFNQGRPFILASHSQGTLHNVELLKYLLNKHSLTMKNQFIAAYLIGNTVETIDIPAINGIHVCQNSTDTNCFLSYNVVASTPESIKKTFNTTKGKNRHWWVRKSKTGKVVCVNPLTWKYDTLLGDFGMHLGSSPLTPMFLTKLDTNFVQARCSNDGVLITKLKDNKKQGYELESIKNFMK